MLVVTKHIKTVLKLYKDAALFKLASRLFHASIVEGKKLFLAWAWLAKPNANVVIPKNQPLPKYLRKKTSKSGKYHLPLRYKQDPLK